ncbi:hypothetical protein [Yersinia sp. 2105 StPb PI]|uniref:hypothetical protein n=1 Tax=Yersinia sp. 2105 StPb PI TaxID=2507058 RepID=UPI000FFB3EC1|nr:hypothetical protein [Yersinia sp. 2105 StPb PI]RXA96716.1 hypothetical protein EQP49_08640 [Yersinia sp. 2105 StPb PI]
MNKIGVAFFSLTVFVMNDIHARPMEPKRRIGQNWTEFQHQHCQWRTGYACKTVPEDEGKLPPKTGEEIAVEVSLGILSGGPTPQPKGFKVGIGAKPGTSGSPRPGPTRITNPRMTAPKPRPRTSTERTPLLPTTSPKPNPKTSGRLQRVNGKIGFLLGDTKPPTINEGASTSRVKVELSDNSSNSSLDMYDVKGHDPIEKNKIDRIKLIKPRDFAKIKEEMENIYGKERLDEGELDIEKEIELYNTSYAHENISFREYFAIRNFQEEGFVAINHALRTGEAGDELDVEIAETYTALDNNSDINISLREDGYIPSEDESVVDEVYRGEVRDRAEFLAQVIPEEIIEIDSFLSTTADEDSIAHFNSSDLNDGQVNVRYTIRFFLGRTNSTEIGDLLDEPGEERIFLPKSRFLITELEESADSSTFRVSMLAITDEPMRPPIQIN